jgi:Exonuclease V gamma subunit
MQRTFGDPRWPGLAARFRRRLGVELVQFHKDKDAETLHGPHRRAPLPPEQARDALRRLLQLRAVGLREPLPFAPYSGWELYRNSADFERAVKLAHGRWNGNGQGFAEGADPALQLALRGRDPFTDEATLLRFADAAMAVFVAVCEGQVYAGVDPEALAGLALADDAEDAA